MGHFSMEKSPPNGSLLGGNQQPYPNGQGEVRVNLSREGDIVTLKVVDDGIGWTGTGTIRGTGLGSKIVRAMAKSLATELRYADTGGRGTQATMELSLAGLAPPASEAA